MQYSLYEHYFPKFIGKYLSFTASQKTIYNRHGCNVCQKERLWYDEIDHTTGGLFGLV